MRLGRVGVEQIIQLELKDEERVALRIAIGPERTRVRITWET